MKKHLLFSLLLITMGHSLVAQTLYTNTTETGSRFNPGLTLSGNPKVAFDDIQIPNATVAGSDSIRITKIKVGIRRLASAPATNVVLYYTPIDDTATSYGNFIKIPPVLLGTVSLPANGATANTTIVSLGDSVSTLFRIKTDTSGLYEGFQTFFIGIGFSNPNDNNGIRVNSGGLNDDAMWIYNADSTVKRFVTYFGGNPPATFYLQVFGRPAGGIFPVTLSSFTGERRGTINRLTWTTATEINNTGFEIQRSADGINFSKLAFIASKAGTGNSNTATTYSFDDVKPLLSTGYYRLKQIDKDGKSTLSNVVLLKGNPVNSLTVSNVYPNPVKNSINLVVTAPGPESIKISIVDFTGKTVSTTTQQAVSGDNMIQVKTSNLAAGNYLLKVMNSKEETSAQKFIKQ